MKLDGANDLKRRLKAIRLTFKVAGREWADETATLMRPEVPVRTGTLRGSFKTRNATQRRAVVGGHYSAYFIDAGTKAHTIVPGRHGRTGRGQRAARGRRGGKGARLVFTDGGRTIFARKVNHPRTQAHPFRDRMAREGLRRKNPIDRLVGLWNRAA